ncbi:MAG TPA: anthranilate synthase component I family protein, partial [Flavobacteriia bacterium]|nr:anthranilate synthase component I family protein [Flavobacteriia bacterium]
MKTINIHTNTTKILADTVTPVGLYLNLRDKFSNSILLESSDYHANDNNFSFICLEPLVTFTVDNDEILIEGLGFDEAKKITEENQVITSLQQLINSFNIDLDGFVNGFFGYTNYDAV